MKINYKLLPVKITYFTLFAAVGILLPYLAVYMAQLGLLPTEIGLILGIVTILTAFVRAVVGMVADKYRRHVTVLIVCCILTTLFHLSLLLVPRRHSDGSVNVNSSIACHNASSTDLELCGVLSSVQSSEEHSMPDSIVRRSECILRCCNICVPTKENGTGDCCVDYLLSVSVPGRIVTEQNATDEVCEIFTTNPKEVNESTHTPASICTAVNQESCSLHCNNPQASSQNSSIFSNTFSICFCIYFAAASSFSPIISIVDGIAYACLGEERMKFGRQRCWGSVGFGVFGVLSSFLMDQLQTNATEKNYIPSFIMFGIFILLSAIFVFKTNASIEVISGTLCSNVGKILCSLELDLLMLTGFMAGLLCGVQEAFLFIFLGQLGSEQTIMGFCGLVQCSSEILVLFYSGKIVTKLGSTACLCVVFVAFGVRFLLYSFLVQPWCVLAIEPLHSICNGLFYPAMTIRASELTPSGMHATVQSFLGTLYWSVGRAVGFCIAGLLFDYLTGPRSMFRVFSGLSFCYVLVLLVYLIYTKIRKQPISADHNVPVSADIDDKGTSVVTLSPVVDSKSLDELADSQVDIVESGGVAMANGVMEASSLLHKEIDT